MISLPLNQGQQAGADAFTAFLFGPEKELVITGGPGVGKTHLLKHLVVAATQQYHDTCAIMGIRGDYQDIAVTATTNTAADILSQMTGWPTKTIHSFMNLKVTGDVLTGKSKLLPTKNWKVHENMIIFVDEASLVDRDLYEVIHEGTHKCKIIWIGDADQLRPVGSVGSPVFNRGIQTIELTEPMRNNTVPELMALVTQLRETVRSGEFKPIQAVPGIIDWVDDIGLEEALKHFHTKQSFDHRVVAYTNSRVNLYNDHIRVQRGHTHAYHTGELVVSANAVIGTNSETKISVEQKFEIIAVNGVDDLDMGEDVKLKIQKIDLKARNGTILRDVRVPHEPEHYRDMLKYLSTNKHWSKFFTLSNTYAELRPHDAATAYKTQGNSHDSVIIDLSNIGSCHNADQVARMLYVAFSRAKYRVIMYGDLPAKYGSIIPA